MMRTFTGLTAALVIAAAAACSDTPTTPINLARFSQTDLVVGSGAEATSGKTIQVHYTGWLYNDARPDQKGAQFDSSIGGNPLTFSLGVGQVIVGWDEGLVGMKVGGTRRLIIPPSKAYGGTRRGPIPANATLVFDVELIEVQ